MVLRKRVEEFAKCNERVDNFLHIGPVQRAALEQYTELVIQECADKVDHILCEKSKGGGSYGDYIRRNFGVE